MFYPYVLYLISNSVIQDEETGETSVNPNPEMFISQCRDQVNGSGKLIQGSDGDTITYNSIIHLPKNTSPIEVGKQVIIYQDKTKGVIRAKGTVLRFSSDSMHCRIWV